MTMKYVTIERQGRIAIVRFDRGDKSNGFSIGLMDELTETAQSFENDSETSAIILTGKPDRFSLGMDLKDEGVQRSRTTGLAERRQILKAGPRMCRAWEELEPMTLCAIEGWCVGGGVALAVSCDLRIVGQSSTLYVPEVERGFNMGWGAVPRITNLTGPAKAKRIIVMAEQLNAQRAIDWGLADEIAEDGKVMEKALEMAHHIADLPPTGVRMIKKQINAHANALNATSAALDMEQFALIQGSEDCAEGIASFIEKRAPKYTGD